MSKPATAKETREVIRAIIHGWSKYMAAKADGHWSVGEMFGMAELFSDLWAAISGIGGVLDEWKDLDEAEADDIARDIADGLNLQIDTPLMRRKIDATLELFHSFIKCEALWRGVEPPRPEIIP